MHLPQDGAFGGGSGYLTVAPFGGRKFLWGDVAMSSPTVAPALDLKFAIPKAPGESILVCTGRITAETSPLLQSTVRLLISESSRIVLDLQQVDIIDSSGVGALAGLWVSTRRAGCEFRLVNLNPRVKHLLGIVNLSGILGGGQE
jgi:anti-sigma B factor antagonist